MGELGKSQLSSLLETVPGLASVLRSPVADAIVNMVRAGAGLREFDINDAKELVEYATRRGLIPSAEGTQLLDEVKESSKARRSKTKTPKKKVAKKAAKKAAAPKRAVKKKTAAKKTVAKAKKGKKATKSPAAKKTAKKKATKRKR